MQEKGHPSPGGANNVEPITAIGFDADDTLWQNERFFRLTQARFHDLLAAHAPAEDLHRRLLAAERRNVGHYGFGIKGFTLSMIETAIEVSGGRVPAPVIAEILAAGREMLSHPIELLPQARAAVEALAGEFRLILITKGDLLDQERKLAQSGLGDLFDAVEIVSAKTPAVYAAAFARHGDGAGRAAMVGNSIASDVRPALAAGAWGIFVPHPLTWEVEHEPEPLAAARYRRLEDLGGLAPLVRDLAARAGG
jgi:putative hydrolase of the HAD superfamily